GDFTQFVTSSLTSSLRSSTRGSCSWPAISSMACRAAEAAPGPPVSSIVVKSPCPAVGFVLPNAGKPKNLPTQPLRTAQDVSQIDGGTGLPDVRRDRLR